MKRAYVTLVLILLIPIACLAQDTSKIDEYVRSEMQAQQIPGVALAVVKDGKVVLARGYGFANVEHQVPVNPETIFQSGSTGKQFTATAVMMLVEEGKLSLEDKITKYFTDAPETWRDITVRHMLTHTSGMTDYPPDFDMRRDYSEDDLFHRIKTIPLAFQPVWMRLAIAQLHRRPHQARANQTKLAHGVAAIINPELK